MSSRKKDHIWSRQEVALLEQKITGKIAEALRYKFRNSSAAVKGVAQETGSALTTVRKWYEGLNPPSLGHFLILCRHYEDVLEAFLNLSGYDYLVEHINPAKIERGASVLETKSQSSARADSKVAAIYGAEFCTINVTLPFATAGNLNQRQLWFMGLLQQGQRAQTDTIVTHWDVSPRTAKTDIASLKKAALIGFVGSQKTGRYILK